MTAVEAVGEDEHSYKVHIAFMNEEYQKVRPDFNTLRDRAARTYAQRQKDMRDMSTTDIIQKFSWLRNPQMASDLQSSVFIYLLNNCTCYSLCFSCDKQEGKHPLFALVVFDYLR